MSLFLLMSVLAADPKPDAAVSVAGIGFVSPDRTKLFVPAKEGGIEALDIATGKSLWLNKDANKVAGASDKLVLAWAADIKKPNTFNVTIIDAASGKTAVKSEAVELPDWATTAKVRGRTFRTAASVEGDVVIVIWQANAYYAGGARPTPEIEMAARKEATGAASIDVKTGKVTEIKRKPNAEDFGTTANAVDEYAFLVEEELPGFRPGAAMLTKVMLSVSKNGSVVWKRELAGNPWSPPPP